MIRELGHELADRMDVERLRDLSRVQHVGFQREASAEVSCRRQSAGVIVEIQSERSNEEMSTDGADRLQDARRGRRLQSPARIHLTGCWF